MIFVDTNVVMYAVGCSHPLKLHAQAFFEAALRERTPLATSAEVLPSSQRRRDEDLRPAAGCGFPPSVT